MFFTENNFSIKLNKKKCGNKMLLFLVKVSVLFVSKYPTIFSCL